MISILEFKTQYRPNKEPVDMVLVAPQGEGHQKTQTWHRVSKLEPPADADANVRDSMSYKDMEAKWTLIGPAYDAWKKGAEIPETGTPLAAWSGVSVEQAAALRQMGIKTVEDVRDMGDGAIQTLRFPNARKLTELAAGFLSGADKAAADAENAELKERIAAMEEMLASSMDKPRRGRPKKEVEAA